MKKIAVAVNLNWPLRRYHDLFAGIKEYADKNTNWRLIWDHYPATILKESGELPYYQGIIGRIKYDINVEAERLNIPVVNTWFSNELTHLPSVLTDYEESGFRAAEYLLFKGYRNFANIDYRGEIAPEAFARGFKKALKPYKTKFNRYLVNRKACYDSNHWGKLSELLDGWIKNWEFPVAVASSMSSLGPLVLTKLNELGLKVPGDVAVINSGDDKFLCEIIKPTLTTVNEDYFRTGYESAVMLDKLLQGKELESKRIMVKPHGITERMSTSIFCVDDSEVRRALIFIGENFKKNIGVSDVVETSFLCRKSLENKFKEVIGHSIFHEIRRRKIIEVKKILQETETKISDISKVMGFNTATRLSKCFIQFTGMSPSEYRQQKVR